MDKQLREALQKAVGDIQKILDRDGTDFIMNLHIVLDDNQSGVVFGCSHDHLELMKRMIKSNAMMFAIMEIAVGTVEKSQEMRKQIELVSHEIIGSMIYEAGQSSKLKSVN